jgi:HD-like signal output (HDOD) protein
MTHPTESVPSVSEQRITGEPASEAKRPMADRPTVSESSTNATDNRYRALRRLPPFPSVATKLLRLLADEDVPIKKIVDLIKSDAALTAELLRVVNSPIYGFAARISSLQNAITLLGFQTVRSFALTVSMKGFLHTALRIDMLRHIWRHSLACALLCEELSTVCSSNMTRDDRAYTAGLLHNIGSLGLFVAHPRTYSELLADARGDNVLEKERTTLGIDHCEAGGWLARNWGFPDDLRRVVITHHEPLHDTQFDLADLVRVAVMMTDCLGFAFVPPAEPRTLADLRAMLPREAQYRFDPEPEALAARITARLDSFD